MLLLFNAITSLETRPLMEACGGAGLCYYMCWVHCMLVLIVLISKQHTNLQWYCNSHDIKLSSHTYCYSPYEISWRRSPAALVHVLCSRESAALTDSSSACMPRVT